MTTSNKTQKQNIIIEKLNIEKSNYTDLIEEQESKIKQLKTTNDNLKKDYEELEKEHEKLKVSRGVIEKGFKVKVTAYTLSYNDCGKKKNHPLYGITANGFNLKGMTLEQARTIAVDTSVIPMNSKVRIVFTNEKYKHLSGEYTARDRGSAIKGNKIDLYFGEENEDEAKVFGVQEAYVEIIENGK